MESPPCDQQITVFSCTISSNCVWLQIIFCSCISETTLSTFLRSLLYENSKMAMLFKKQTWLPNDKTIIELAYRKTSPNNCNYPTVFHFILFAWLMQMWASKGLKGKNVFPWLLLVLLLLVTENALFRNPI